MADFARVLAAIDEILNTDSLGQYLRSRDALASEVLESDGVALAVVQLLSEEEGWQGTASQLLTAISSEPLPRGWPDTPRKLSQRLREAQPTLRTMGIDITFTRASGGNRARLITLTRSS